MHKADICCYCCMLAGEKKKTQKTRLWRADVGNLSSRNCAEGGRTHAVRQPRHHSAGQTGLSSKWQGHQGTHAAILLLLCYAVIIIWNCWFIVMEISWFNISELCGRNSWLCIGMHGTEHGHPLLPSQLPTLISDTTFYHCLFILQTSYKPKYLRYVFFLESCNS